MTALSLTEAGAPGLWQATLDALPACVAVLDEAGDIVVINRSWSAFAEAHGRFDVGVGANYLRVCDQAAADDAISAEISDALRELLAGTRTEYEVQYASHGPGGARWYAMRVVPSEGGGVRKLIITQNDVTACHESECRNREQAELLDAVGAAIIASDLDGLITHWSDGAERLYGWRAAEDPGPADPLVHHASRGPRPDGRGAVGGADGGARA